MPAAILQVWIDHGSDEDWGPMCNPPMKMNAAMHNLANRLDRATKQATNGHPSLVFQGRLGWANRPKKSIELSSPRTM